MPNLTPSSTKGERQAEKRRNTGPTLISIEGNIGAGKSELLKELRRKHEVIPEPVEEWEELLTKYYQNPCDNAYNLQVKALESHTRSLQDISGKRGTIFVERSIFSIFLVFIELACDSWYFPRHDRDKLEDMVEDHFKKVPQPKAIFFLHVPSEVSYERMVTRDRPCEQKCTFNYIHRLKEQYDKVMIMNGHYLRIPIIILDGSLPTKTLTAKIEEYLVALEPGVPRMAYPEWEQVNHEYLLNTEEPTKPVYNYGADVDRALGVATGEKDLYPHLAIVKDSVPSDSIPPTVVIRNDLKGHEIRARQSLTIRPGETRRVDSGLVVRCESNVDCITIFAHIHVGNLKMELENTLIQNEELRLGYDITNSTDGIVRINRCQVFATITYLNGRDTPGQPADPYEDTWADGPIGEVCCECGKTTAAHFRAFCGHYHCFKCGTRLLLKYKRLRRRLICSSNGCEKDLDKDLVQESAKLISFCSICNSDQRMTLDCGHKFCSSCLHIQRTDTNKCWVCDATIRHPALPNSPPPANTTPDQII